MNKKEALAFLLNDGTITKEEYEMFARRVPKMTLRTYGHLVDGYEDYLKATGFAQNSVTRYLRKVRGFLARGNDFDSVRYETYPDGIADSIDYCLENPNSVNQLFKTAFSSFNSYLESISLEAIDMSAVYDNGEVQEKVEIKKFTEICKVANALPVISRTILFLEYDLCLPLRMLTEIHYDDIDWSRATLTVDEHKYYCSPFLIKSLGEYVKELDEKINSWNAHRKSTGNYEMRTIHSYLFQTRKSEKCTTEHLGRVRRADLTKYFKTKTNDEEKLESLVKGFATKVMNDSKIADDLRHRKSVAQIREKYPCCPRNRVYAIKRAM